MYSSSSTLLYSIYQSPNMWMRSKEPPINFLHSKPKPKSKPKPTRTRCRSRQILNKYIYQYEYKEARELKQ
ncbi:hypothetical protein BTUL_0100g00440 [Botrytis tulipae]|uniref:Uncharacterized protein n=1 Tax=Botrytis tulipae TaxID=87230 RepID=A0A4Z1ESK1_9HELO|nr:hypothetical protein BTUL_0100g00440 [Botrytis tulipae]